MSALLEIAEIKTYYGQSQVLFGMSLAVNAGEVVTLMGRNGMGKTTTIRSVMGLTPCRDGRIFFGGRQQRDHHAHTRHVRLYGGHAVLEQLRASDVLLKGRSVLHRRLGYTVKLLVQPV